MRFVTQYVGGGTRRQAFCVGEGTGFRFPVHGAGWPFATIPRPCQLAQQGLGVHESQSRRGYCDWRLSARYVIFVSSLFEWLSAMGPTNT